jgi:hypothetical protein
MKLLNETWSIDMSEPAFVRIDRTATVAMPWGTSPDHATVWIERQNLPWLVGALRDSIWVYGCPCQRTTAGQDSLRVDESGAEAAPFINIYNERPAGVTHEGAQLITLTKAAAIQLLSDLERLQ